MKAKGLSGSQLNEIKEHIINTGKDLIKCYSLKQLSLIDGKDTRTIRASGKYLPVRVDSNLRRYARRNNGAAWKSYSVKRIRVDEIKYIFSKRNGGRKLITEY